MGNKNRGKGGGEIWLYLNLLACILVDEFYCIVVCVSRVLVIRAMFVLVG